MACSQCAKRRKAWEAKRAAKAAKGKKVQAAAIGAALSVTEAAGKALGIHGEVGDEESQQSSIPESGATVAEHADAVGDREGAQPDR